MISRGSEWHRWEPHIHAPNTVLNNQFGSNNPWEEYLTALEKSDPKIEAIAVTDYYITDLYEQVVEHKGKGRLPNVKLIFPNIELRLDIAAKKGFVNLHLLVSPEDADHISETKRLLKRLYFYAYNDRFDCTREELIKLGKLADPKITHDNAALRHGATQFKVNFSELQKVISESEWAKKNILIAVAGGSGDGTAGLQQAADATIRQEIEKFSHIIFSSSPVQREFWLGQTNKITVEQLCERYDGCKPCLHGCDAHDQKTVGSPQDNRFSWIKGAVEFDALRQACIDPEGRAYVGICPPKSVMPSQAISHINIKNTDWIATPCIPLNHGLVTIIGARGSGKTALADMIAAGCDAVPITGWDAENKVSPSFLARANSLIGDATATLTWGGGIEQTCSLDGRDVKHNTVFPRARYLSQQFVEELCSSKGMSDGLIEEIERVIFSAHSQEEKGWATDFTELREAKTIIFEQTRQREAEAIIDLSKRIASELEKKRSLSKLTAQINQKKQLIGGYTSDREKIIIKGTQAQRDRHVELSELAQKKQVKIQSLSNQRLTFISLQNEVVGMRTTKAPEMLRDAQQRHIKGGLSPYQWEEFLLIYKGDVDNSLSQYISWADKEIDIIKGTQPVPKTDLNVSYIEDDVDLDNVPLMSIMAEVERISSLLNADNQTRKQYDDLTARITKEASVLNTLEARLVDAQEAESRAEQLRLERDEAYSRLFDAIINKQLALAELYAPLMVRLSASTGTLNKLSFSVQRIVDINSWGTFAEENLLDRRKTGSFYGRGSLIKAATDAFQQVWTSGTAQEIKEAMANFKTQYLQSLLQHAPHDSTEQDEYYAWIQKLAHWLYDTKHVTVCYEIAYDGVDIRKLSPGTRGIVLLLLYLALDETDDRPLIIDQPEENLDPKSVFDELVDLFIKAKSKRQVIMVTHNANLVINTDADQIIVAESSPSSLGNLPTITYTAGGLENATIRKAVCNILEGGEKAFRERARRLRVRLER